MKVFLSLISAFVIFGATSQASISINNYDFETGGVPDGFFSNNPAVVPTGWNITPVGAAGAFYGYLNPQDDIYPGTTGLPGVTGTMAGPNVFYFGDLQRGFGLSQTLGANFAFETNYDLTVAWGIRLQTQFAADLRMTLSVAGNILADRTYLANDYKTTYAGTFFDVTLPYAWNASHSPLVGSPLTITFFEEGENFELDIDNVRLTSSPVPEPSTYALLLMTGAGLLWLRKRRF
jgi:hypothetical protein